MMKKKFQGLISSKMQFNVNKSIGPIYFRKFFSDNTQNNNKNLEKVKLRFKYLSDNSIKEVEANVGDHVLAVAHKNDIDIEGACDASLACSTCHVILEQKIYDNLPKPVEEEDDLLDLAFGLTHTSRLGCQVIVTKEFEGTTICVPSATRNLYVDGHKPKPH